MAVVEVKFRANADFSDLIQQAQAANLAIENLNRNFSAMQRGKIDELVGNMNKSLVASGQFTTQTLKMASASEEFGKQLDRQKLKLREYYNAYKEFHNGQQSMIRDLARQQTMLERSTVVSRGRDAQGKNILDVITPTGLDSSIATKTALARKELQILNKVLMDGSTALINWGKNTQWAGRQLTVGLTVPLTILGGVAAKAAYDMDKQLTRIVKVYGNSINSMMSASQTEELKSNMKDLAMEMAKQFGQTADQTLGLAADIAAVGKTGKDLTDSVIQTTRLATLGEVDRAEAMKATLAIQTAFKQNTDQLAESINFLNAVENQTSTSLQDLVEAIPKAGPVVEGLGGTVKDLALMMVAMREGGVPAAEAANAIKSGLASIINPTKQAREMLQGFGIDIKKIQADANGQMMPMLMGLQEGLSKLSDFDRSRVIEQMFGKFQFARMTALFENLGKSGSQTLEVMKLMGASAEDLAKIADRELGTLQQSISGQFDRALETLKTNLAGVGEEFLMLGTKGLQVINALFDKFNSLPDFVKNGIGGLGALVAVIGPVIMTTGVLGNLLGYIVKGVAFFKNFGKSGTAAFEMLTAESVAAKAAGDLMERSFYNQATAASVMTSEINKLVTALANLEVAQAAPGNASAIIADQQKSAVARAAAEGLPVYLPTRSLSDTGKEKAEFTGTQMEFSHFYPSSAKGDISGIPANKLLAGSSIVTDPVARKFQQDMKEQMRVLSIGFLDSSAENIDELRKQMVIDLANTRKSVGGNEDSMKLFTGMSPQARAQLFPSMQEFKATNVQYAARVKAFIDQGRDQIEKFNLVMQQEFANTGSKYKAFEAAWKANPALEQAAQTIARGLEQQIDSIIATEQNLERRVQAMVAAVDSVEARARAEYISMGPVTGLNFVNTRGKRRGIEGDMLVMSSNLTRASEQQLVAVQNFKTAVAEERAAANEQMAAAKVQQSAANTEAASAGVEGIPGAAVGGGMRGKLGKYGKYAGVAAGVGLLAGGMSGDGALGAASSVAGGAMMGGSMGMMAGPWGAAIGAGIGALATGIPLIIENVNKASDQLRSMGEVGETAIEKLGGSFKTLADIGINNMIAKTEEAKTKYQELKDMFQQAPEGSSDANFIALLASEDNTANLAGILQDKVTSLLEANVSPEDIKTYLFAAISAAGKDDMLATVQQILNSTNMSSKAQSLYDQLQAASKATIDVNKIRPDGSTYVDQVMDPNEAKRAAEMLTNAAVNQGYGEFYNTLVKIKGVLPDIATYAGQLTGDWQRFAQNIQSSGGDTQDVLRLMNLQAAGMKINLEELSNQPWRIKIIYDNYAMNQTTSNAVGKAIDSALGKMQSAASERAANAGGAVITADQQKKAADAAVEAQRKRIDKIKKHYDDLIQAEKDKEDRLKKLQEAEKRRLEREKIMRDAQVSYNEAIAAGNFGQAALIKNNISAQQKAWDLEDKQREQDDKAKARIDALEAARDKALAKEEARLEALQKASQKTFKDITNTAASAATAQSKSFNKARNEIKAIFEKYPGDFAGAINEIMNRKSEFQALGVNVGTEIKNAMKSVAPQMSSETINSLVSNFQRAPWDMFGKAVAAKISGDKKGYESAINVLQAWIPGADRNGYAAAPSGGGRVTATMATGGYVEGPGHGTSDEIPARLSNGEYVIRNAAVTRYGKGFLDAVNERRFAGGGLVDNMSSGLISPAFGAAAKYALNGMAGFGSFDPGSGPSGNGAAKVIGEGLGAQIARYALNFIGTPYSYTGMSPSEGWGCAPFVHWIYSQFGYKIPGGSLSYAQYQGIKNHPNPGGIGAGDLMFFKYANGVNTQNPINHVGMYIGGGNMVHAANPKRGTIVSPVDWGHFVGAGRPIDYSTGEKNYAMGGLVAKLKAGEFVINDGAVKRYGAGFMNAINNQTYHSGGLVTDSGPRRGIASGGGDVYNFEIHGADPKEIVDEVMIRIEQKQKRKTSGR